MILALGIAGLASSGCYTGHLAAGQARMILGRQSVAEIAADPETPASLRESLLHVQRAREHAAALGLEVGDQYTSYVAWEGDRLVTTVTATRPGSVEIAPFSYPFLGNLPYKGFFDPAMAAREADGLRARGLDVCVSPVAAYSTLGWLNDPVTTPMLQRGEGPLVETVVHELVHANIFVDDDPEFNESIATFVGEEASLRYFQDPAQQRREHDRILRKRELSRRLLEFRKEVIAFYASDLSGTDRAHGRRTLEAAQRKRLADLDPGQRIRLNDACLALHGTYAGDIAHHAAVLESLDGDLRRFVARLHRAEAQPRQAFGLPDGIDPLPRPREPRNSDGSGE